MAYGYIPNIKSEGVLCQEPCLHTDCAVMRKDFIAHNKCRICGEELKIDDPFSYDGPTSEYGEYSKTHYRCS